MSLILLSVPAPPSPAFLQALKQTLLQHLKVQAPADVSLAPPGKQNRSHKERKKDLPHCKHPSPLSSTQARPALTSAITGACSLLESDVPNIIIKHAFDLSIAAIATMSGQPNGYHAAPVRCSKQDTRAHTFNL